MSEKQGTSGPSPLVPTISVTPHSPAGKHYPILGMYFILPTNFICPIK